MTADCTVTFLQGTNAHLILREEADLNITVAGAAAAAAWQRRRFWHSPAPHALLHRAFVSAAGGTVSAEGTLDRAAVAFLLDHKVMLSSHPPYTCACTGSISLRNFVSRPFTH